VKSGADQKAERKGKLRALPRRNGSASEQTSENTLKTNFLELRYGEVRRIRLLRTPVNKGEKKGAEPQRPPFQPSILRPLRARACLTNGGVRLC
jgi:hypothetical protein